jgi:osmotically-inducible protein OsmY
MPAANPKSYEDIVRKTVMDPDSSVRPSGAQEQAAHEGFRALDDDERQLNARVNRALAASGSDAANVTVEVNRDLVTLRGQVVRAAILRTLEDLVAAVPGVGTIHNQVVVATTQTS